LDGTSVSEANYSERRPLAPRTGHAVNREEPDAFNRAVQEFFGAVERGKWGTRDPPTLAGSALIGSRTRRG
jgi:hypothetical protein